ncbi:MAG: LPS export ABC transporter periplasmic protein LptC [Desulfobulbaceae bacterium]|nr:LPS export ABC transporter periplasmic protein LptC [Candidatus Kapabacteria bacterium]MBS3999782.1 LPS export ABC transporter periplasmic protein LptC [Desulfobulbaceae bacterium]
MKSNKNILIFLLFNIVLIFSSCDIDFEDKQTEVGKSKAAIIHDKPDQIAYDIEVLFVDSSFTKAILKARKARIYNERYETFLDSGMQVTFFERNSPETSILTADSARIDDRTKNMLARGNVIVVAESKGRRLETQLLEWDNMRQKIYTTEFVTISTPTEIINGYGFESDPNLNEYKINRVSGIQKRGM